METTSDQLSIAVHYYLLLNNMLKTLDSMQAELPNRKILSHHDFQQVILKAFDRGDMDNFSKSWNRYVPETLKKGEYEKIEFYTQIYFTTLPLVRGPRDQWETALEKFKDYLNTKGAVLCRTSEFLPFYALPHIPNPQNHPSFQHYFTHSWGSDLRNRIQSYLTRLSTSADLPTALAQNPAMIGAEENQHKLKEELKKAKAREDLMRSALLESQTKWTAFCSNIIAMIKQLLGHISGSTSADLQFISRRVQEYERFLVTTDDSVSNASSLLPVAEKGQLTAINYSVLKRDLFNFTNDIRVCTLLQALRWRLTRTPASVRKAVLSEYISVDLFNVAADGLTKILKDSTNRIQDFTTKIVNVLASEYAGRTYLLRDNSLIPTLVRILYREENDSTLRQNTIGILQKLSLRKGPQSIMIELNMIQWLCSILRLPKNLSEYTLEYSTALLMNLSLRTAGKNVCEDPSMHILELLANLIKYDNIQVRTYINGTLYSVLTRQSLKSKAKAMNLEVLLNRLSSESDEAFRTQIDYVLEQMNCEYEDSCCSDDENDEEDVDNTTEDEDELISDDEDHDDLIDQSTTLIGEDLLKSEYARDQHLRSKTSTPLNASMSKIYFRKVPSS